VFIHYLLRICKFLVIIIIQVNEFHGSAISWGSCTGRVTWG
jgi:hypothetical protein